MKLDVQKIYISLLKTPTYFANEKGVDRKYIYKLFEEDKIDFVEIDGVKFVFMNEKAKAYKKSK